MPDALALEREAVLIGRLLAEEREGNTGDVERQSNRGMRVVEGQEGVLEVVLPDKAVGSLGARDEVCFDAEGVGPRCRPEQGVGEEVVHITPTRSSRVLVPLHALVSLASLGSPGWHHNADEVSWTHLSARPPL